MTLRVSGIGTAVPTHSITQADAAEAWAALAGVESKKARTIKALYRKSRIQKRHSTLLEGAHDEGSPRLTFFQPAKGAQDAGPTTEARMLRFQSDAPDLAARASSSALEQAGIGAEEITHLVTVSCTGFFAPGPETALVDRLGLPPTVERTNVGFMGCHGSLNGLRVASAFTGVQPGARVLVSSTELCTLHMAYDWDPDTLVANSLFGDGAAALVGVGESKEVGGSSWKLVASGTCRLPDSADAMTWRIGDHGFRMTLATTVPDIIRTHLRGWAEGWLGENGLTLADVATWAVHPGGPRILKSVEEALELSPQENSVAREVLAEFGNMSSATILFILDRLRRQDAPRPLVAMAFGPGLVAEAALFL